MFPKHAVTRASLTLPYIRPLCHLELLEKSRTGITPWPTLNLKDYQMRWSPRKTNIEEQELGEWRNCHNPGYLWALSSSNQAWGKIVISCQATWFLKIFLKDFISLIETSHTCTSRGRGSKFVKWANRDGLPQLSPPCFPALMKLLL